MLANEPSQPGSGHAPFEPHARLRLAEVFGLEPWPLRIREAWLAVRGDPTLPPSRFGVSSLGIFWPMLSLRTWAGLRRADRRVPISCLFNRTQTPPSEGWSVKKTQVRDFRGGTDTYDSHNGTDFAVPVGTVVTAAATGLVLRISSELNRGGLKIFIDHGRGLITTSNHLGRALVRVGDTVQQGQPIALSAYSGLDALIAFPWSVPHLHFNVWLNGHNVDPFAEPGETPLWEAGTSSLCAGGGAPRPVALAASPAGAQGWDGPTTWDEHAVAAAIATCKVASLRRSLTSEPELARRAMNVVFYRNYYPTRFEGVAPVYDHDFPREPRLTLPFRPEDFDGIALPGE